MLRHRFLSVAYYTSRFTTPILPALRRSLHAIAMPSPPQPELPHPAHVEKDSALGRKFGQEVVNYFGGEHLCLSCRVHRLTLGRFTIKPAVVFARGP
jgi:hypothetical protein